MTVCEDDCVCCDYCVSCGRKNTPHYYCDKCGSEETLYDFNGEELCKDCVIEQLDIVEGSDF